MQSTQNAPATNKLRILVIDDSLSALEVAENVLREAGYQVVGYNDPKSAIKKLENERFDLIITDIYMPDEDGLEVISESRRICPKVPIIAMSGATGERSMLRVAMRLGACQTLQKPYSTRELLGRVARCAARATT